MQKYKVMLVDDELDFLDVMSSVIKSWGYDLTAATGGEEALKKLKADKPDIVVLDYLMPVMDGIAVLREIRKIDTKIPVIMFTAHPNIKVIKGTKEFNISAFIPKLSTYSDVSASLKATLEIIAKGLHKEG